MRYLSLAAKKSSARVGRKTTARKTRTKKLSAGTYIVPRGHVSVAIPAFWTLRQTNDDLEIEAPSGSTSVIVTAFQRNGRTQPLDAREYLKHFLETAPRNGKLSLQSSTKTRAAARYRDAEGDNWEVAFITNGTTLLMATCNTSLASTHKEAKTGIGVLDSIAVKK